MLVSQPCDLLLALFVYPLELVAETFTSEDLLVVYDGCRSSQIIYLTLFGDSLDGIIELGGLVLE